MNNASTIRELIVMLEEIESQEGDMELRVATQPQYPLAHAVANVRVVDGKCWIATENLICAHDESPYAPREAWEEQ